MISHDQSFYHEPVLLDECIEGLNIRPDGTYVDCTLGGGGHFSHIVNHLSAKGTAVGIDRDDAAHDWVKSHLSSSDSKVVLCKSPFSKVSDALDKEGMGSVDGALFDLGVSSKQFDDADRGFTYRADTALDMRMDRSSGKTAAELIEEMPEDELARVLGEFGEVQNPRRMAGVIKAAPSIKTSGDLLKALEAGYGKELSYKVLSKIFQALRIAVNGELDELGTGLSAVADRLNVGGRLVVISYHSLEDRIVKNFLRDKEGHCECPPELLTCRCGCKAELKRISRKAIVASAAEIARNPRARSAKLRIAEKVA